MREAVADGGLFFHFFFWALVFCFISFFFLSRLVFVVFALQWLSFSSI